jgi:hypothetical protein
MLNPDELRELGRERQRALIAWRGNQTRLNKLPPLERAVMNLSRRVITAIRSKLESLDQAVPTRRAGTSDDRRKMASE